MDAEDRYLFHTAIEPLQSKEMLGLIEAITLATAGGNEASEIRQQRLMQLVISAHEGTDEELAREIEPLTRRSR